MMPTKLARLALVAGLALGLAACAEDRLDKVVNPASANCVEQGGTLEIETRGDGGQYGVCHLADGRQCEEWALMRGDCPKTGVDVSGVTSAEARYCVIQGGQLVLAAGSCTLSDGKSCALDLLYAGTC